MTENNECPNCTSLKVKLKRFSYSMIDHWNCESCGYTWTRDHKPMTPIRIVRG